jgi:HTH-type transcriptional regulator / antitoxin HigA
VLGFFEIGTPQAYEAKVRTLAVHHRQAKTHETSKHPVFTWLTLGERKARKMNLPAFDEEFLKRRFGKSGC